MEQKGNEHIRGRADTGADPHDYFQFQAEKAGYVRTYNVRGNLLTVVIGPIFSPLDLSYVENAHTNMPPGFSMLSVPGELKGNVKDIGIGNSFSVGLSNDGNLYIWGNTAITNSIDIADIPDEIRNANIVDIAVGNDHALAIDDTGRIYVWGNTRQGQDKIPEEVENLPYDQIKR